MRSLLRSLSWFPVLLLALAGCAHLPREPVPGTPAAPATSLAPPPVWSGELAAMYEARLRVGGLESRRFQPELWWRQVTPLLAEARGFRLHDAGRSAEGRPLTHVEWGRGATPVLLWSQMHGDESTATMALADLFRFLGEHPGHPLVQRLRSATTLHLLPLMNPDGAARFQRRNAQGIDINRDAAALASPEARALKGLFDEVRPAYAFNLHDQQAGYRAGDSDRQVAIALLAPPPDGSGTIGPTRGRAIELAVAMRSMLESALAGHIARWDDTSNPRAFGDLTAQWGASTVLIEAGGIDGDPQKQQLRRHVFMALLAALDAIATGSHEGLDHRHYFDLPENGAVWPDLLIRGATLVQPGMAPVLADVRIDFSDSLAGVGGRIRDVGDLSRTRARRVIYAQGLYLQPLPCPASSDLPASEARAIAPETPACLQLSRDAAGREPRWTLLRDMDPARPPPGR